MFNLNYSLQDYSGNEVVNETLTFGGERYEYNNKQILNSIAWDVKDKGINSGYLMICFEGVKAPY